MDRILLKLGVCSLYILFEGLRHEYLPQNEQQTFEYSPVIVLYDETYALCLQG
jgi:hypothetical protein